MPKENLVHLSQQVLAMPLSKEALADLENGRLGDVLLRLPEGVRGEINQLFADVRDAIPNDFEFHIFFEPTGIMLRAEYEDGNTGSDAGGGFFTSRKSMLRKLRRIDWDSMRAELIRSGGIFEELVSKAADRPVDIPLSREVAAKHSLELGRLLAGIESGKQQAPFVLIVARADQGVAATHHQTRADVVCDIADFMTTGCDILAVLDNGQKWTFDAIEAAKLEAVEHLGPISRARAEHRLVL